MKSLTLSTFCATQSFGAFDYDININEEDQVVIDIYQEVTFIRYYDKVLMELGDTSLQLIALNSEFNGEFTRIYLMRF